MPLASYSDLKSDIATWLSRSGIDTRIANAISLFEAEYNATEDNYFSEAVTTLTTVIGNPLVTLPTDFRENISLSSPAYGEIPLVPLSDLNSKAYQYRGRPEFAALYPGSKLKIGPTSDAAYPLELIYEAKLSNLSDTNTTNWMLAQYPFLYLYGSLKYLLDQIQDNERATFIKAEFERLSALITERKTVKKIGRVPVMRNRGNCP